VTGRERIELEFIDVRKMSETRGRKEKGKINSVRSKAKCKRDASDSTRKEGGNNKNGIE
jgi:hypothetical protein